MEEQKHVDSWNEVLRFTVHAFWSLGILVWYASVHERGRMYKMKNEVYVLDPLLYSIFRNLAGPYQGKKPTQHEIPNAYIDWFFFLSFLFIYFFLSLC